MDGKEPNTPLVERETAVPLSSLPTATIALPDIPIIQTQSAVYERPGWGAPLSLLILLLMFALPVYLAYIVADTLQPIVDTFLIEPIINRLSSLATTLPLLYDMLVGDYGIITLGLYSFLWAFPVVLFRRYQCRTHRRYGHQRSDYSQPRPVVTAHRAKRP